MQRHGNARGSEIYELLQICHLDRSMMVLSSCEVERPACGRARCECWWRALRQDLHVVGAGDSAGISKLQVSPLRRQKSAASHPSEQRARSLGTPHSGRDDRVWMGLKKDTSQWRKHSNYCADARQIAPATSTEHPHARVRSSAPRKHSASLCRWPCRCTS